MMTAAAVITALIFGWYAYLITRITRGWERLPEPPPEIPNRPVSVVVAFRNEETNLAALLESLYRQDYPADLLEIILVNDHSEDGGTGIISEITGSSTPFRTLMISNEGRGKKAAIRTGVNAASGAVILTTDADCTHPVTWVRTLASCFSNETVQLVSGPVQLEGRGAFAAFQKLEFLSLVMSGAGAIGARMPIMCNGANLAYRRNVFQEAGPLSEEYLSGDDVFLMLSIAEKYGPQAVAFAKSRQAIVKTHVITNWHDFIRQRMRWTSKSRGYTNRNIQQVAVSVFLINLLLVAAMLGVLFHPLLAFAALGLLLVKAFLDGKLLVSGFRFFRTGWPAWIILPAQVPVAFYTVFTALAGLMGNTTWKGRKVKG